MSKPGHIAWFDLTVPNADKVRDFYQAVVGWTPTEISMGDYADYAMVPPGSTDAVSGICWQRGTNTGLPAVWLPYIMVDDLNASVAACQAKGGEILMGPKSMGAYGTFCVIRDPAGATCALAQAATQS